MPTARVERLIENHVPKFFKGDEYVKPIYLSPERTRHYTESYKQTEGEPMSIRRAKALAHHLDNMRLSIRPDELIVGNYADDPHVMPLCIEASDNEIINEYIKAGYVKKEDLSEWKELLKYWEKNNSLKAMLWPMLTKEEIAMATASNRFMEVLPTRYTSRTQPDHDLYLETGVNKIITNLHQKLEQLYSEKESSTEGDKAIEIITKITDVKAMIIAAEALVRWTKRYSELAKTMAENEKNPERKKELMTISAICSKVPGNSPTSFWEAMQSHWFAFLGYHVIELLCHGTSLRADQVFWPWYERDVVIDKTLPREKAMEIMEDFLIKIDELGRPLGLAFRHELQGVNYLATYTIGGVKADGSDASNELTMLILDIIDDIKLSHPDFKFRWHPKVNPRIWRRACELIRTGIGQPSIKNDRVVISFLIEHYGLSLEEARSWAVVGCVSPSPTLRWGQCRRDAWSIKPAKYFELALNNGEDPVTTGPGAIGFKGLKTGNAEEFKSYQEVFEAFRQQIAWFMRKTAYIKALGEHCNTILLKRPLASCFFHRSLEACQDILSAPEKSVTWVNNPGIIECVDSFIGLKKLVFDDKKYTMAELLTALRSDWVGYEKMRQDFINAPKFGNDDDYADDIAKTVYDMLADEMSKVTNINGMSPMPSGLIVTNMFLLAPMTGAMPNGRKLGDALADGGISPHPSYDKNGPMAAVLSASKIDSERQKANVFNQKLNPSSVEGEAGLKKFQNYIETAMELGLDMIQFNIVDAKTLKDAQQHPDKHQNLVVRVSGYNARFLDLDRFVQDAIINRTEHVLA